MLPKLPRDPGDRNRTSPFAFTGNKFEFRAVSSGQSIAMPNICLNVAVTDALDTIATELEKAVAGGKKAEAAAWALLPKVIKQHKRIIFNGNNYADEWQKDAKKRGLLNLRNTVDALPELVTPAVIKAFEKQKVLNARELQAREEINYEAYNKTINVEAQLMVLMANRYILPAALQYQKQVGEAVAASKSAGAVSKQGKALAVTMAKLIDKLKITGRRAGEGARALGRQRREAREVLPRQGHPDHGRPAGRGRRAGAHDPARDLAAPDVPGDALHQVKHSHVLVARVARVLVRLPGLARIAQPA